MTTTPDALPNGPTELELAQAATVGKIIPFPTATVETVETPATAAMKYPTEWRFCLIKKGVKGPETVGWNQPEKALIAAQLGDDVEGIGLLHAWSGTCAIDVDNEPMAREWLTGKGIDLPGLMDADDAVQVHSGNPHHGKLIYKLPKWLRLPSKRVVIGGKTILEFRHGTAEGLSAQDVLPPSIHPKGAAYQWAGKGSFTAVPELPSALLGVWQELIDADSRPRITVKGTHNTSVDEITSALACIDPDERDMWRNVGMGLQVALGDDGVLIWNEWSKRCSAKYPGEEEVLRQWRSFKDDKTNGITIATMFMHAYEGGWIRPAPDVTKLFAEVKTTQTIPGVGALPAGTHSLSAVLASLTQPAPQSLDLDLLPPPIAMYAREVAASVGCDATVPALAALATLCGAVDARSRVRASSSWTEPPIVWFVTHGQSADKKTAGAKQMTKPLRKLEMDDHDRYQTDLRLWQGKEAKHSAEMKAYLDWEKSAESGMPGAVPPTVSNLPSKPEPKQLVVMDVTSQEAVRLAMVRPYGLTMMKDEMADWLQRVTDPKSGENRSAWVEANEGNSYRLNRTGSGKGAEHKDTNCLAIAIYGNCQPLVWAEASPKLVRDGMRGRFIVAMLNTEMTNVSGADIPEFMSVRKGYEEMITRAHAVPAREFGLSPAAKAAHRVWESEIVEHNKELKRRGFGDAMQQITGKLAGTALRVALLFHLAETPYEGVISEGVMVRAVAFVREFVMEHAIAVEGLDTTRSKLDRWVVERVVKASASSRITLSEMRRVVERWPEYSGRPASLVDDHLIASIGIVERLGWVALGRDDGKTKQWLIDPALTEVFAAERERLLNERDAFTLSLSTKSRGQG